MTIDILFPRMYGIVVGHALVHVTYLFFSHSMMIWVVSPIHYYAFSLHIIINSHFVFLKLTNSSHALNTPIMACE